MKNSEVVLHWLCRDYASAGFWKSIGKGFFLTTIRHPDGNSDSDSARRSFASFIKAIFDSFDPKKLSVEKWHGNEIKVTDISPPSAAGDDVCWDWIADYLLLSCAGNNAEIAAINAERTEFNNKTKQRLEANVERMEKYYASMLRCLADPIRDTGKLKDVYAKRIQKRPELIEEDKLDGEFKLIQLPVVSAYKSKYFPAQAGTVVADPPESPESQKLLWTS